MCVLQSINFGDFTIGQRYKRILNDTQRHFAFYFFGLETGITFLYNKSLYVSVIKIARPNYHQVGKCGVSNPLFLTVDDPCVALPFASARQPSGYC
jgi:hypothetical protein